ncbi:Sel1 repeat protein [Burkholderiales bacterium JOSHI_001]|nr:Sel1 repeat protein [Burkholderiales bacterium JOSHI_001]
MSMVPFLWMFDAYELPDVDTRSFTDWKQAWAVMDRLRELPPRPNVRRQRLATLLVRQFPEGHEPPMWEEGAPDPAYAYQTAVWSPYPDLNQVETVMPAVVSNARELMLDLCDDVSQVYLPARGLPLPKDDGLTYLRTLLHSDARRPWADAAALRQAVADGLARVLGPAGFTQDPDTPPGADGPELCFKRTVPDGRQTVRASFLGPPKAERCVLTLQHRRPTPGVFGALTEAALPIDKTLSELRVQHEPAWRDERTGLGFIDLVMTRFWLEWLLEDLAQWGLPLLQGAAGGPAAPASKPEPEPELTLEPMAGRDNTAAAPAPAAARTAAPDMAVLRRRADAGDVQALQDLADAYYTGEHVPQDFDAAAAALTRAAELGLPSAMFNLGVCFRNGQGRPQDADKAWQWFCRAADLGHGQAIFVLAQAYRRGLGVPQDVAASNALMVLAQARGVAEAIPHGVVAGAGPWADLAKQMMEPGQITRVLKARHAPARSPGRAVGAAARAPAPAPAGHPKDGFGLLLAGLGLCGVFSLFLLKALPTSVALSLQSWLLIAGAFGVFRLSGRLGHGSVARVVLALLALVPLLGALVCGLQVWRTVKRRPAASAGDD